MAMKRSLVEASRLRIALMLVAVPSVLRRPVRQYEKAVWAIPFVWLDGAGRYIHLYHTVDLAFISDNPGQLGVVGHWE
jgi:hypothetical protein